MFIDFEFANKRLSDIGYVMCRIDKDSGIREVDIGCDITFNTIKNYHSSVHYITSSSYENVYSTTFDIIKDSCKNKKYDLTISESELRDLMMWLNRREHRELKLINAVNSSMNINYYGSFNIRQIMHGDKIIGLSLTFTSNAPYGFGDPVYLQYDIASANEHFFISCDSDEIGLLYPSISVKCKENGNLKITNHTTGSFVFVANCLKDETIFINGEHKIIITDNSTHDTTIANDFNYEYLDIQTDDDYFGENEYEVSMPCVIEVNYSPIRKVGVN